MDRWQTVTSYINSLRIYAHMMIGFIVTWNYWNLQNLLVKGKLSMIDYIRCHYINSENGIQCESWHSVADGDMCPVHVGMVSSVLAANGINRDEYIDARKKNEISWRDKIQGKTPQEQCNIIDAHLAGIEKVIEEQKLISLVGRAIR